MHLSARESGTGNGFPPPPALPRAPPFLPSSIPRNQSSFPHTNPFALFHPPRPPFDRSVPLESARFISLSRYPIPSGNYYKSESQSIFNPRGMVFGPEGKGSRTNERTNEGGTRTERNGTREGERGNEKESGDHGGIARNWCNNASNAIKYTTCRAMEGGFLAKWAKCPLFVPLTIVRPPFRSFRWFARVSLRRDRGHSADSPGSR